jgi:uncharacterized protein YndB with AHSA1/START domain
MTPVGKTKTQGWEVGVRRTFAINTHEAWTLLTTQPGLGDWLGHGIDASAFAKGQTFTTDEGTQGEIRSYTHGSLIRMRWQPATWDFASTLQLRVLPAKTGATISIHHEQMRTGEQREAMRQHWTAVMDRLAARIDAGQGRVRPADG